MTEPVYVSANGFPVTRASVVVGWGGPWTAEVHMPNANVLTAPVRLRIGSLELVGAPVEGSDGVYADQRRVRLAGGAAGWAKTVTGRGYHNDAGVKGRLVAEDAARDVGETLGDFIPSAERVGVDFAREPGPASRALEAVSGSAAWWVDYAGVTQVGLRPVTAAARGSYVVLSYDPSNRTAELQMDDPTSVRVGSTLVDGLDVPGVVREIELVASGDGPLTMHVWLGGTSQDAGRLASLLGAIAARATDGRLYGLYRYRVVERHGDGRLDLQGVDKALGLPDLRSITPWPGVAGVRMTVAAGGQVLVAFADGDRARPVVTSYQPYVQGASGFEPDALVLGGASGEPAAREGDAVACGGAGYTIIIGALPTPAAPVMLGVPYPVGFGSTAPAVLGGQLAGRITEGSDVVSIAPEHPTP